MNVRLLALLALLSGSVPLRAQALLPFDEETLRYTVNWPSGLSLGEAEMHAKKVKPAEGAAERWEFDLKLEAAVPGFMVTDQYRSTASAALCSIQFEKDSTHGNRKTRERTTVDAGAGTATRQTLGGGGKSEMPVPACARDALAFLYYTRGELSRGRIPPAQAIFFGGAYSLRLEYSGRQDMRLADAVVEADRMVATVKGKASSMTFEIFFAVDAARRPLLVRLPLPMGTFVMQLVP